MNPASPFARISLGCIALFCVVPYLQPVHFYPLTSFYTEWLAIALGTGVMVILLDRRVWEQLVVPWVALPVFALAALLIIHGALGWSPYFGQALMGALYLLWAGALIVAARALAQVCGTKTVITFAVAGLAAGALVSALIGIVQHFNWVTPFNAVIVSPTAAAITGNIGQSNHFGAYTTLGLIAMAYLYSRGCIPLAAAALGAMPMLFVLGLSGSRSVWLYLLAALALAAGLIWASRKDNEGRRLFLVCAALIIGHSVMQLLVGAGWFKPAERETVTAIERLFSGAGSISIRFGLWHAAWSIAMEQPFSGIGWGGFAARYFEYATESGATAPLGLYNNAHNIVLQLFVETGILGAALLLATVAICTIHVLRAARNAALWWLLATMGVLAIHSLLEYPLWYAHFLGLAALLLGLLQSPGFVPRLRRSGHVLAAALLLASSVNLALLWMDYRDFERLFRTPVNQFNSAEIINTIKRLHRSPLLAPYVELAAVLPLPVAEQNLSQRLSLYAGVLRLSPLPELVYRQVLQLALADRQVEARELLVRARRAYPAAPDEFKRDLAQLAGKYPERILPLLESGPSRSGP